MRFLCLAWLLLFLLNPVAAAQNAPQKEIFVGYSFVAASPNVPGSPSFHAHGGVGSLTYYPRDWFGIVADLGGYRVSPAGGVTVNTLFTYLFGPRLIYPARRAKPFLQLLAGGAHARNNAPGAAVPSNGFAMSFGGGIDLPLSRRVGLRLGPAEYLFTRFGPSPAPGSPRINARLSTGVFFRF